MSEELKKCPFCGGETEMGKSGFGPVDEPSVIAFVDVTCKDCGAMAMKDTEAEAVTAWNTRAKSALFSEMVGALEEIVGLVDDIYNGGSYTIDSFTCQPAKAILTKAKGLK